VDLDRESIEKHDFPLARRGYDPAVVDAHLAALADLIERERVEVGGRKSASAVASGMIRTILEAAETTAADIERGAEEQAAQLRHDETLAMQTLREAAAAKSQSFVSTVASSTEPMITRAGEIERELDTLIGSVREGASRLSRELAQLRESMTSLSTAASAVAGGEHRPDSRTLGAGYDEPEPPPKTVDVE
jgi:DivIVA domain-containing protein